MPPEPDLPAASPPPAQDWTPQEQWIWERTLGGEVADFDDCYHEAERLDPRQDDARWSEPEKPRLVGENFLLDVLGRKPYLEAIPWRGLRIVGARFASDLDLQSLHVERQVWLEHCRFEGAVNLESAEFDRGLSFDGSAFNQVLKMNGLTVGQILSLADGRFAGEVDLNVAKVDGQLKASGATFEAGLNMNSLTVGQNLFLSGTRFAGKVDLRGAKVGGHLEAGGATFAGEVDLGGAKVDGQLNASGATFEAGLNMSGLTVGQVLSLADGRFAGEVDLPVAKVGGRLDVSGATFAGEVDLPGAKVDGQLKASGATFEAGLNMENLTVGQYLLLDGAIFAGEVSLVFAEVGVISLGGATFHAPVDASGLTTKGELRLDPPPTWGDHAWFVLRNAHVGALHDGGDPITGGGSQNPWPIGGKLELDGFSYGRLGGLAAGSAAELRPRPVRWYIEDWLARDTSYTPQPYQQLAGVLQAHGDPAAANAVLFAARERERSDAWREKAWPRWIGLSLLRWTIGYGLGWRYFLVLIWIGLFTLGGAVMLWTSGADKVLPAAGIARSVAPAAPEAKLDKAGPAAQDHVPSQFRAAAPQAESEDRQGFFWCLWASFDWMLPFIELDKAFTEAIVRLQGGLFYLLYIQALAGYVLAGFLAAGLAGLTQSRG